MNTYRIVVQTKESKERCMMPVHSTVQALRDSKALRAAARERLLKSLLVAEGGCSAYVEKACLHGWLVEYQFQRTESDRISGRCLRGVWIRVKARDGWTDMPLVIPV